MIGILHLSDMHLKEGRENNPILKRVGKIVDSVANEITECSDLIIIFSGDIAYSGKAEEYEIANEFFNSLVESLKAKTKAWIRLFFVAGNHDCYFEPNSVREAILNQANSSTFKFDQNIIDVLCNTQKEYLNFVNSKMSYWRRKTRSNFRSKMYDQFEVSIKGRIIKLHCFNSASFSKLTENAGSLNFPIELYNENLTTGSEDISISILHHPLNWLNTDSHRSLRNKLIEISDLVFTGHEHVPDEFLIERKDESSKFIESGALQDNGNDNTSEFGLIMIRDSSKSFIGNHISYSLKNGIYQREDKPQIKLSEIKTKRNKIATQDSFQTWLEEIGAPIAHPRKEDLYLDDFYVYPDIQVITDPNKDTSELINNEHSSEELLQKKYCIVVGSECSGKTSFLKKVFDYKLKKGLIPIYLEGEIIKKFENISFNSTILRKAFHNQYETISSKYFDQIDHKKIVILIDNFGNCPLDGKKRVTLIENLKNQFNGLYITSRELIHFDPINSSNAFDEFYTSRILELNHDLRKKVIYKWNALGQTINPNISEEISAKNLQSIRFVNSVLQKHFTEPFPIYILTLLQVHDANSNALDHGSIGFYYEYLIKHSLQESIDNKNQVSLYEAFLIDFCYFLFEERINNINEDDFQIFLTNFKSKKRVTLNYSTLLTDLINSNIIRIVKGQVSLHQPYIYYYFVSRALDDRLNDEKTQKRVERMINRLYIQEFEGIILFLSHLSSNTYVLETLKTKCKSYFTNFQEATIDQDILSIDSTITNEYLPLLEATDEPSGPQSTNNEQIPPNGDANINELEYDPDKDVDIITSLNKFVRSLKTFELMGNVVKINYAWDYEKKIPLVKETYGLGLRLMTAYFKMIENGADEIVAHIRQISTEKEIENLSELKEITTQFTRQLAFGACYNLIRRIAYSLGHKQLRPLFQEISKEHFTNAYKLIEFSIDLLQLGIYNESEVKKYLSSSRGFNRPMARLLLRNFIYEYTQLFKIDVRTRQKINDAAQIQMKDQRIIQSTSKKLRK